MSWESVITQLADVAKSRPGAVALLEDGQPVLSYETLWQRAGSVAAVLHTHGIERGSVVGIALHMGTEYVTAIIGCWRAGCIFVPVAREWPIARLAQINDQCSPRAVFTEEHESFPGLPDVPYITPDRWVAAEPLRDVIDLKPDDDAYILYTSGSTGKPKGVAIPHRGLPAMLTYQIAAFRLKPDARNLVFLSRFFDAHLSDLLTTLLIGATLVVDRDIQALSPRLLEDRMRLHEITHADLPPALLTLLNPERLPTCFATVIIGGEVCPPATVRRWAAYCRVVNVYGPTEATICTSTVVCRTTWVDSDIGTPVPGIRYRVVDDQGQPMTSPGQGELWIGGDGLASGYVGQPALARSPFLVVDNERWYRTGDLVELIDDGSLCFRGRLDRQFKVHGVLVQPEEIEAALCACPGVSAAFAGKAAAGGGQLHAWVTGENLHRETLLQLLSDKLPMHLLPAALHLHPEFSLTTTGKIDGKALIDGSEAPAGAAAASDPMQSTLQRVWADVLDIPLPAPQAVLSVDSLAAMHACVQLADAGIDSMPNHLMLPTIAAQASALAIAGYEVNTIATETLCSRVNDMPRPPQLQVPTEETPTGVLLTGATGFLGRWLLRELLRYPDVEVCCLLRGSRADATARLATVMAGIGVTSIENISVITGDVAAPRWGMDDATFSHLTERLDLIVHAAGTVNLLRSLEQLEEFNVNSLIHMHDFMASGRAKTLHHASSLSVFVDTDLTGVVDESTSLSSSSKVYGGYAQSKFMADAYLSRYMPYTVQHRFGLLVADTIDGVGNPGDTLHQLLQACLATGCYPTVPPDWRLDYMPVDVAARAMISLAMHRHGHGGPWHINNPVALPLSRMLSALAPHRCKPVPIDDFISEIEEQRNGALLRMALGEEEGARCFRLCKRTILELESTQTWTTLEGMNIQCPLPEEAFQAYVARLCRTQDDNRATSDQKRRHSR